MVFIVTPFWSTFDQSSSLVHILRPLRTREPHVCLKCRENARSTTNQLVQIEPGRVSFTWKIAFFNLVRAILSRPAPPFKQRSACMVTINFSQMIISLTLCRLEARTDSIEQSVVSIGAAPSLTLDSALTTNVLWIAGFCTVVNLIGVLTMLLWLETTDEAPTRAAGETVLLRRVEEAIVDNVQSLLILVVVSCTTSRATVMQAKQALCAN